MLESFRYLNKPDPVIVVFAIFNFLFHFLFAGNLEYHRDELLYFSLGMHPDFGYVSVPPLIGAVSWLMQNLFGYSVYAVRILPAFLSGLMMFLAWGIAKELGGKQYSMFLAAFALTISPFFMRSFSLFMPVSIEIFLWTLCIYLILRYINTSKEKYLLLFGIAAGISLLNKYLAGLFFTGLAVIIPFTRHREVFTRRMFWIAMAAGALIFSPNIIWQAVHGFPVFNHIGELYNTQLIHMNAGVFLTEQLVSPFAGSVFTIAGLYWLLFSRSAVRFRFLGFLSLFVIIILLLLKGKSYYTLGVFPLMIFAGAVALGQWIEKRVPRVIIPLFLLLITLPVVPMGIPVLKKEGLKNYFRVMDQKFGIDLGRRFEDGTIHSLPQDYADMLGWIELTQLADSAFRSIEDKKASFIYAENYGQAGAVTVIGKKYGLPQAVCFSETFRYWIPQEFNPDITSLIYINDELGEDIDSIFVNIIKIGIISDPDAREYGTGVWLCREPVAGFNSFWKMRLRQLEEERE